MVYIVDEKFLIEYLCIILPQTIQYSEKLIVRMLFYSISKIKIFIKENSQNLLMV